MFTRPMIAMLTVAMLTSQTQAEESVAYFQLDVDAHRLAMSEVTFSKQMYHQLRRDKGNIVFSPYSVQSALMMTLAGAGGDTARQMFAALSLPAAREHVQPIPGQSPPGGAANWQLQRVHQAARWLNRKYLTEAAKRPGIDLAIANGIWPAANFPMHDQFVTTLQQSYGVTVTPTTFPQPGADTINQWVEAHTNKLIKNLLAPEMLTEDTQLVLVNAIYFKGNWRYPFDPDITGDRPFHLTADRQINVPTMMQNEDFKYLEDDTKQVLELPYKWGELSMVIVLPKKVDGLAAVEKALDMQTLAGLLGRARHREVSVYLPKFKIEYAKALNEPLQAMGMKLAFTDKADFTAMSPRGNELYVSLVQHKAFIEVNETGSEAAAATAVAVDANSASLDLPPVFKADRPFVFYIRHVKTGAVLFMGRMTDPRG